MNSIEAAAATRQRVQGRRIMDMFFTTNEVVGEWRVIDG